MMLFTLPCKRWKKNETKERRNPALKKGLKGTKRKKREKDWKRRCRPKEIVKPGKQRLDGEGR